MTSADCPDGQVCDSDTDKCRAAVTCAEAGCADHQLCREASAGSDASCLADCEDGFSWNAGTQTCDVETKSCEPDAGDSILQECTDVGRKCVEDTPGEAECGECLQASQLLDQETGRCRDPIKCDGIECGPGEMCVEGPGRDAFCSTDCSGPNGEQGLVNQDGACVLCPLCDDAAGGEDGPFLDSLTRNGDCICKTRPGFYWSLAPIGVETCDADGDGWVRIGAQTSIDHDDAVISSNARCNLRSISAFVLHNEGGETMSVQLAQPAGLYESKRNDDQAEIEDDPNSPVFSEGRPPQANEINSLTKACVAASADYNENGLADVNEWHTMSAPGGMNPAYQAFLDYSYFIELHRGWYEPGAATTSSCAVPDDCPGGQVCDVFAGLCQAAGEYHIREKSRAAGAPSGLDLALVQDEGDPGKGSHWRACIRKRDSAYDGAQSKQGMDFGQFPWDTGDLSIGWHGMNHHSQFKCLKVSAAPDQPNEVTKSDIASEGYQLNTCTAAGSAGPLPVTDSMNPSDPQMSCIPLPGAQVDTLENGDVRWAVQDYLHYDANSCDESTPEYDCTENFIRGCVNECAELEESCPLCLKTRGSCPGYHEDPVKGQCTDITTDFGRLLCGCGEHFGGGECQVACPESDLMKSDDFSTFDTDLESRSGYWMCGHISSTTYPDGQTELSGTNTNNETYTLRGEVPSTPTASGRLEGGGYTIDTRSKKTGTDSAKHKPVYKLRSTGASYGVH